MPAALVTADEDMQNTSSSTWCTNCLKITETISMIRDQWKIKRIELIRETEGKNHLLLHKHPIKREFQHFHQLPHLFLSSHSPQLTVLPTWRKSRAADRVAVRSSVVLQAIRWAEVRVEEWWYCEAPHSNTCFVRFESVWQGDATWGVCSVLSIWVLCCVCLHSVSRRNWTLYFFLFLTV